MKKIITAAAAALLSLSFVAATAGSASAYVACNGAGECWHTDNRHYDRGLGIQLHPDDYYFHRSWDHDHWRDYHGGRGYYRNGVWITF
jgi:hypothetical protein